MQPSARRELMPDLNATITGIVASFFTHNDNKDNDSSVSVFVQNRVNLFLSQDIARLENFAGNTEFGDDPPSTHSFDLTLASNNIRLSELSLPTFRTTIAPVGNDRWIFDVTFTIVASDASQFSSTTSGIILDQDNRTFNGVMSS
jgi:hypothetical protein